MNLRQKAEACREAVRVSCDKRNFEAERQAIDEFEQGEVAEYFRQNAAYVTGLVVSRLEDMKAGKPTFPFRPFDAETLVRLLSAVTTVNYEAFFFN